MTSIGVLQIAVFFLIILALTKPVGLFMSRLFAGERTFLHPILRPLEVAVYKVCGVKEQEEQKWTHYTASVLAFSLFSFLFVYALMRLQGLLPFNPQGFGAGQVNPDVGFNTAMSFMTNTNWQGVQRRVDHELSRADGRAGRAELRVGGGGHRRGDRAHSRLRPA